MAGSDGLTLELPDKTEVLVSALSRGESYEQAAKRAEISVRTVERRMADPAFAGLVSDAHRAAVERGAEQLVKAVPVAIDTLLELLGEDASAKPGASTRLKAAQATLDLANHLARTGVLLQLRDYLVAQEDDA